MSTNQPLDDKGSLEIRLIPGAAPRLVLHGDLDFLRAQEIRDSIVNLLEKGYKRIEISLADVVFMDSSGISALLDSVKMAWPRGAQLVLEDPSPQLVHLLEVSGFKPFFEFAGAALAAYVPTEMPKVQPFAWQVVEFAVPCDRNLVPLIRYRVAQLAASMPFTTEQIEDIKLAVGEASTNAFRYGCREGCEDCIRVRAVGDSRSLSVEVTDAGPGFDAEAVPEPSFGKLEPGGRGIWFMRITMDEVEFFRRPNGMTVRMVKYLRKEPG